MQTEIWIIAAIAAIMMLIFGRHFFERLSKMLFFSGIIIIAAVVLTGFLVYLDIDDLRQNFQESSKKIILVNNDEVLTGFLLNGKVSLLENSQLKETTALLQTKDYKKMLGNSYKLMVFDVDIVGRLDAEKVEIDNKFLDGNYALGILKSDNPFSMLQSKNIGMDDLGLRAEDAENKAEIKAALFGSILSNNIFSPKDSLLLFSELRSGSIVIYPETALFKAARIVPLTFIKNTAEKIFAKTKETARTLAVEG